MFYILMIPFLSGCTTVSWKEAFQTCQTPRDICNVVSRNLTSKETPSRNWSPAEKIWSRGEADCKDYATCVVNACKEKGLNASIVLYYPPNLKLGHAVVIGTYQGKMWMSSNGEYSNVQNLTAAKQSVAYFLSCKPTKLWEVKYQYTRPEDPILNQLAVTKPGGGREN